MTKEQLRKMQDKFDMQKWLDSEMQSVDTCGSYEFCGKCVKEKEYPCARAKVAFDKANAPKADKVIRVRNTSKKISK